MGGKSPHDSEKGTFLSWMPGRPLHRGPQAPAGRGWGDWGGEGGRVGTGEGDRVGRQGHWGHTDTPHLSPAWGQQENRGRGGGGRWSGALPTKAQRAATPSLSQPPSPRPNHSPRLQSAPRNPAGQRQAPVAASQEPPWRHPHGCSQPGPNRPGGHPARTGAVAWGQELGQAHGSAQPSQGRPGGRPGALTLPAAGAVVASGTRAGPQGGVAGLVLAGTTALLPTALPKGAWRAGWGAGGGRSRPGSGAPSVRPRAAPLAEPSPPWGCRSRGTHSPVPARAGSPTLLAAGPREARWTATLPGDVVAGRARRALAALATVLSKPATRAGCGKPCAGVAGSPRAGAGRAGGGGTRRQGPPPPEQRGPRVQRRRGAHRSHTASPSIPGGRGRPP